ncbi:hypothetical protein F6A15_10595 [Salmonella enterica]|nr:hypothetical protein [Salmonella enterica]
MNNLMNNTPTMTSQEIADLVGSRHDSVKRSIERLVNDGVIQLPPMADCGRINGLGISQTSKHYLFKGEQGRRDSIVVVAQLCPKFTGQLVDHWQDLKKKVEQLSIGSQLVQHRPDFDVVALASAVAEATVSIAIKTALEAVAAQQHKAGLNYQNGENSDQEFVTFDYTHPLQLFEDKRTDNADSTTSVDDNNSFLPIRTLSIKTGLAESTCRRLVDFAHIPARRHGGFGLHVDSEAFIAAVRCLIDESKPPKGKIKRWQHPEFGGFTLLSVLPESRQAMQG